MNLRQKVKQAKKELAELNERYPSGTMLDIYDKAMRESDLREIINYKRKPSRTYKWNDDYKIDWDKLTFISFQIDFKELLKLNHPNGKVLSKSEIKSFLGECFPLLQRESERIAQIDVDDKDRGGYWKGKRKRVDYVFLLSNDRTKSKRLHIEYRFFQYEGDARVFQYENRKRQG